MSRGFQNSFQKVTKKALTKGEGFVYVVLRFT